MRGGEKPKVRKVKDGHVLVEQGQLGSELYLLLDGVLAVDVDGEALAELGPGAILGERAVFEGGRRTARCAPSHRCASRSPTRTRSTRSTCAS